MWMCMCMCICVCIHTYIRTYIHPHPHGHRHLIFFTCIYIYTQKHIYIYSWSTYCILYLHIHTHTYMYTHTYRIGKLVNTFITFEDLLFERLNKNHQRITFRFALDGSAVCGFSPTWRPTKQPLCSLDTWAMDSLAAKRVSLKVWHILHETHQPRWNSSERSLELQPLSFYGFHPNVKIHRFQLNPFQQEKRC